MKFSAFAIMMISAQAIRLYGDGDGDGDGISPSS